MAKAKTGEETAILVVKGPGAQKIVDQIKRELEAKAALLKAGGGKNEDL